MTVIDIITRVDVICKKYERYDVDKQRAFNVAGDDAFARLFTDVENGIEGALQVSIGFRLLYIYIHFFCSFVNATGVSRKLNWRPKRRTGRPLSL